MISPDPLDELQRDDKHTLHCLDYIREELQCHSDITLQGSDEYIKFQNNNGHQCRDFEAITEWTAAHQWSGHQEYLDDVTNSTHVH